MAGGGDRSGDGTKERDVLQDRLAFLSSVVEQSSVGMAIADLEGCLLYVNRAWAEMHGFDSGEEFVGRHLAVFHTPRQLDQEVLPFNRRVAEKGSHTGEVGHIRRDGAVFHALMTTTLLLDERGAPMAIAGTATDLSRREAAELRFQLAAQAVTDLIYEWDVRDDSLRWFGDIDAALGYPSGTIPHTLAAWLDLIHPEDIVQLADAAALHRTSTEPIRYEYRVRAGDGSWRYWRDHGLPLLGEGGAPRKWIGGCLDVTEQRLAEARLRDLNVELERRVSRRTAQLEALNRLFRGAIGSSSDVHMAELFLWEAGELTGSELGFVGELDTEGRLDVISCEGLPLLGYHTPVPLQRLLVPTEDVPGFLARVIRRGRTVIVQDVGAHPGHVDVPGEHAPLRNLLVVPLHHGDRFTGFVGLANKDGAFGAADREIVESLSAAFVETLLSRRADIALLRSNRELDAANRELEAFAYSVSHDLRGPLGDIDTFAGYLEEDATETLDEEGRAHLARIRERARHSTALVDRILAFSRVTKVAMQSELVDLSALADSCVERLRRRNPGRAVAVEIRPRLVVRGDPTLLGLVLRNLLGNAWKFTKPRKEARILVGRRERDGALFVRDNGVGFDMAHAARIFGTFQRLHTERDFPGTGVGLAIVQRIVQRHGGRVWAEAGVGQGATFYFTLP